MIPILNNLKCYHLNQFSYFTEHSHTPSIQTVQATKPKQFCIRHFTVYKVCHSITIGMHFKVTFGI